MGIVNLNVFSNISREITRVIELLLKVLKPGQLVLNGLQFLLNALFLEGDCG